MNYSLIEEHKQCAANFERIAKWIEANKAKYEKMPFLRSTLGVVISDLDKKDWRDILDIQYNKNDKNGPLLTAHQLGTLLVKLYGLAHSHAT